MDAAAAEGDSTEAGDGDAAASTEEVAKGAGTDSKGNAEAVKHDVSLDGNIGRIVEKFKTTMEVSLDGKLGPMAQGRSLG